METRHKQPVSGNIYPLSPRFDFSTFVISPHLQELTLTLVLDQRSPGHIGTVRANS